MAYPNNVLKEGETVILTCKVEGYPKLRCMWTKDDVNMTENCLDLNIKNISRTDSGYYRCVAENKYGTKVSNVIYLDVYCK